MAALSYGLVRVPKKVWENRDIRLIFGFHCFHIKAYQSNLRDASIALGDQYAILQLIKAKVWALAADGPTVCELREAIEEIEEGLPKTADSYLKGWKRNQEAKKSKFLKPPTVTLELLASFNYYLQAAVHEFEMAEHIHEKNIVEAYYYRAILDSLEKENPLPDFKLAQFHSKEMIFKLFPGFGILSLIQSSLGIVTCTYLGLSSRSWSLLSFRCWWSWLSCIFSSNQARLKGGLMV